MLKCVIFDMDGTIADTVPLCVAAFRHAVEPILGRSISDEEILTTFGPSEEGTIRALVPDHYDEGLTRYLEQYRQLHEISPAPFGGIVELLHLLKKKGFILALVTGKGTHSLKISMEFFGLNGIFDAVETGSPSGPNKPAGLREVLRKFGLHPKDCVYIGDAPGDVIACREVGVPVVSATWAPSMNIEQIRNLKPDRICLTVEELKQYLTENIIETNKKRVVLVTGASRGLGAAIAKRLGRDGFRVAVNYFNSPERADEVVAEIVGHGGTAKAFKADVTREEDVKNMLRAIAATWGNVEILVNNATGPQPALPLEEYSWKDFEDQINFFIKAPFMLMQELIDPMKKARWGKVINIGSEVAEDCRPNFSPYVTAKCAMLGLTRTWALEFAPWNIAVNLIAPGWIPTERHKNQKDKLDEYLARIPMGRHGVPEDVAFAVSFLAAEETTFISGQRLSVNGAFTF